MCVSNCRGPVRRPLAELNGDLSPQEPSLHSSSKKRRRISHFFDLSTTSVPASAFQLDDPISDVPSRVTQSPSLAVDPWDRFKHKPCQAAEDMDDSSDHLEGQSWFNKQPQDRRRNQNEVTQRAESNSPVQDQDRQAAEAQDGAGMQEEQSANLPGDLLDDCDQERQAGILQPQQFHRLDHLGKFSMFATKVVDKAAQRHGLEPAPPDKARCRSSPSS